jgi:hypothetical protein
MSLQMEVRTFLSIGAATALTVVFHRMDAPECAATREGAPAEIPYRPDCNHEEYNYDGD